MNKNFIEQEQSYFSSDEFKVCCEKNLLTEPEKELLKRVRSTKQFMASFANFSELDVLNSLVEKELVIRDLFVDSFGLYSLATTHENKDLKKLLVFLNIENKERMLDENCFNKEL